MSIRIEIGIDCADPEELAPFWSAALGYELGELNSDGVYLDLIPRDVNQPIVYFQRVPEPKSVKNRVHLDLWSPDPLAEIARLVALGASLIGDPMEGPSDGWWQVMADPAGNEFCVCKERDDSSS
ncbi:MAG: VOC family protein [Acidimicrobiales bacterium]